MTCGTRLAPLAPRSAAAAAAGVKKGNATEVCMTSWLLWEGSHPRRYRLPASRLSVRHPSVMPSVMVHLRIYNETWRDSKQYARTPSFAVNMDGLEIIANTHNKHCRR